MMKSHIPDDLAPLESLQRTAAKEGWSAGESNALAANEHAEPGEFYVPGHTDREIDEYLRALDGLGYDTPEAREAGRAVVEAHRGSVWHVWLDGSRPPELELRG